MALANYSLPYQPVTVSSTFFYPGTFHVNTMRLNAVLPTASEPEYDEEEPFRNLPYATQYHQQQRQQRRPNHHQQQQQTSNRYPGESAQSSSSSSSYSARNAEFVKSERSSVQSVQFKQPDEKKIVRLTSGPLHTSVPTNVAQQQQLEQPIATPQPPETIKKSYPERPTSYTKVNSGFSSSGAKTSLHAILDYDDDNERIEDYYDDGQKLSLDTHSVTPVQGPILLKNGKVPVVPLNAYPRLNNGTLVQIPLLWTALSVALGVELKGDLVKGIPCVKKNHQLYCPTAGTLYPIERIEQFIDENKALIKRMYGEFEMDPDHDSPTRRKRTSVEHDLPDGGPKFRDTLKADQFDSYMGDSYFSRIRKKRQDTTNYNVNTETGRTDVCQSKIEIVTPYWSRNSAGKLRAVVNTRHFEQAIHQEVCSKPQTNRCGGDCGCEQKYKWHRLLAYDPDNDCKGIFMDWFLFPSCCVCRCDPANKKSDNSN